MAPPSPSTSRRGGIRCSIACRVDFDDGDERVAAALVRFADHEPASWDLALVPGQDPRILGPDEVFGYGVDSGTGSFTSPEVVAADQGRDRL